MELGEKLRRARLESGLTQRQLCGEEITRNMLSLIENGAATPSMKTLQYLAARLGKPVSFFLEEDAVVSPNQKRMEAARACFDKGDHSGAMAALEDYRHPDAVYDRERQLLWNLTLLALAEQALPDRREVYAQELLAKTDLSGCYCERELQRRRLLLLGRLGKEQISGQLPSLDEELLLRAEEALAEGNHSRAAHLLDAAQHQEGPRWNLLRGQAWMAGGHWLEAARCLHKAEDACPRETIPALEQCYRELEDYRQAYVYACKQK